jgi:phosphoenolpyruvate synthase/pyruvate phosphate dikinase
MPYTRWLDELHRALEPSFGGKSASLGELLTAKIPVPPGFAISTDAYRAALRQAGIESPTPEAIEAARVPRAVRDEIAQRYDELAKARGEAEPPVAVRSSAVGEDTAEATFAGLQATKLWVRGADDVCDAVRTCWASLYGPPAVSYRERLGAKDPAMGVAVQLMVDAAVSGVMFTCNPVSGDPSMVAINASWGLGQAVVGGEVTPDDLLISKVTGEVVRERLGDKALEHVPHPAGRGTLRAEITDERRTARCLDDDQLRALVDVAREVQRHFGSHQDIEWAIARDGTLFIVQSRPVTGLAQKRQEPQPTSAIALVMSAFGADRARGDI